MAFLDFLFFLLFQLIESILGIDLTGFDLSGLFGGGV